MMTSRIEWTIDSERDSWYLEYWKSGEYWSNRHKVFLSATRFDDAVIEARIILNLD